MKYIFQRDDNGELYYSDDFDLAMAGAFVTLPDGTKAKRRVDLEVQQKPKEGHASTVDRPILSDNLGCTAKQVDEFRFRAKEGGFTDVEFVPDKNFKDNYFYQAKFTCRKQWEAYKGFRGKVDKNGRLGSGATLSEGALETAKEMVEGVYGPAKVLT